MCCSSRTSTFRIERLRRKCVLRSTRAADGVYARGGRVKVAVIFAAEDLGAIPSLFGQPGEYAHFLGVELGFWYVGPLLVLMPSGFGFYDGDRSTAAAEQVLRTLSLSAGSPDALAGSAAAALRRLDAAGVLRSPDVTAPLVTAHPAFATRGKVATPALRPLRRQRPQQRSRPHLRTALAARHARLTTGLPDRHTSRHGALAGPDQTPQPPAPLLRRRRRPGRKPQQTSLCLFPSGRMQRT